MFDTHSHVDAPEFEADCEDVLLRAREAGVDHVLIPNINLQTLDPIMSLCAAHTDMLRPMIGLHPEDADPRKTNVEAVLDEMEQRLADNGSQPVPYVAVGEVGLDLYWDDSYRAQQIRCFERQVGWARRYKLPLMIHCRNAHRELMEVMQRQYETGMRGVFHCFAGTEEEAAQLLAFDGFVLGIGGVLTFKKSTLPEVLRQTVPLQRVVLETDAPYLAPVPHRGKRNEPSFLPATAQRLAQVYETNVEEVEQVTNANVARVFGQIF